MIEISHGRGCITVTGHAGYAEHGKDIVCSAISALTQVFIASVEQLTTDKLKCVIAAGNAVIRYEDLSEHGQLLIKSFFVGLKMIADEYPQYVRIVPAVDDIKSNGKKTSESFKNSEVEHEKS